MVTYEIDGAVLRIEGDLFEDEVSRLQEWCNQLMTSTEKRIALDLSGVTRITSCCVGVISATWVDVLTQERKLSLVVSPEVRRVLTLAGFHRVFELLDPEGGEEGV